MDIPWILAGKLAPPAPPATWLPRERLGRPGGLAPATVLIAGPGYGKTLGLLALADRVPAAERHLLWYALDAGDADPVAFFQHLLVGMRRHIPRFGADLDGPLAASAPDPVRLWQGFFAALAAYNLPRLVLALDDLHHLADARPDWVRALGAALDHLPPRTHLLVSSRRKLPLALARARAAGTVDLLDATALRFDAAEEAAYVARRGGPPPEPTWVATLDGWPLGLQLATSGLAPAPGGTPSADLTAYVAEELYQTQPEGCRAFMLRAALLPALDLDACRALLADGDAARWLPHLEAEQLVQPLADGHGHRFPPYLQEFLAREATRELTPAELAAWHHRAAAHHAARGRLDLAVPHHFAAGDLPAAFAACREAIPALAVLGRFAPIERWIAAFPAGFEAASGHLPLWRGMVAARLGSNATALEAYELAQQRFAAAGDRPLALKALVRRCTILAYAQSAPALDSLLAEADGLLASGTDADRADLHLVHALVADQRGDLSAMRTSNEAVLATAERGVEVASAHWIARVNLYTLALHQGELDLATKHAETAIALAERHDMAAFALFARFLQAHLHVLRGEPEAAAAFLRALPPKWDASLEWQDLGAAWMIIGHTHQAKGEWREAEDALARSLAIFERADHKLACKMTLERLAWLALQRGQPARALAFCDQAGEAGDSVYDLALGLARARAHHLDGHPEVARWEPVLAGLAAQGARLLLARARLYQAATQRALGRPDDGAAALAACEADAYGFLRHQDAALWAELVPLAAPEPDLELRCFGGLEARVAGHLRDHWPRRKARRLLAALALAPGGVGMSELIDLLEETSDHADAAVRTTVMSLRRVLEPELPRGGRSRFVVATGDGYGLAPGVWVDVQAFEGAIARARVALAADPSAALAAYRDALVHYRGNLLAEPGFVGFFEGRRRLLQVAALEALRYLHAYGEPAAAEATLRRAIELAPCEEDLYLALMRHLEAAGQLERARQVYWDFRRALKAELGLAPSPAFEAAHRALMTRRDA